MMSYITPPVALAAVAASAISKSNPLTTGLIAMRLGSVLFILPFLFVISPTLILHGTPLEIAYDVTTAVIAVWLLSSALEGWLYGMGALTWARIPVVLAAACFVFPETISDLVGFLLLGLIYLYSFVRNRQIRQQKSAAVDTGK
jgi:TRAP-type uncharacterized transport system fused permease subunit